MSFDSASNLRATFLRFTSEARKANRPVVELLVKVGAKKKATPAQVPLAWLLAQKPWIVPIPGTRRIKRLEEILGAASLQLTAEHLREIESGFSKFKLQGARLSEAHMALIDR